jgi:hypothetical protein
MRGDSKWGKVHHAFVDLWGPGADSPDDSHIDSKVQTHSHARTSAAQSHTRETESFSAYADRIKNNRLYGSHVASSNPKQRTGYCRLCYYYGPLQTAQPHSEREICDKGDPLVSKHDDGKVKMYRIRTNLQGAQYCHDCGLWLCTKPIGDTGKQSCFEHWHTAERVRIDRQQQQCMANRYQPGRPVSGNRPASSITPTRNKTIHYCQT